MDRSPWRSSRPSGACSGSVRVCTITPLSSAMCIEPRARTSASETSCGATPRRAAATVRRLRRCPSARVASSSGEDCAWTKAFALLDHLGLGSPVAVLGYSLGGLNAYHLAAAHPGRVSALVNIDTNVEVHPAASDWFGFLRGLPYTAPTREELIDAAGAAAELVAPGLRPLPGGTGWRMPFHPQDMLDSVEECRGDHWNTWLASDCPALVINGTRSHALPPATAEAMASRRPGTSYAPLDGDHFVPFTDPDGVHRAVARFLSAL